MTLNGWNEKYFKNTLRSITKITWKDAIKIYQGKNTR